MKRVDGALSHNLRSEARRFGPLLHALLFVTTVAAIAHSASAAPCSDPEGVEGEIVYNTTYKVVQFCNGTRWIGMGGLNDVGPDNDTLAALGCLTDQVPKWSGSNWTCADDDAGGVPAGTVAGAVQFRGASAVFAADDTNLAWDDLNNQLGIGTPTPQGKLHVKTAPDENLLVRSITGELEIAAANDANNAYVPLRADASAYYLMQGYVGIGTTNPLAALHVENNVPSWIARFITSGTKDGNVLIGATGSGQANLVLDASDGDATGADYLSLYQESATLDGYLRVNGNGGKLHLSASATPNLTIDDSGDVGIGTTTPSHLLHLRSAAPYIGFQDTEDPNGSIGSITQFQDGTMFYDADVNNTATPGQHIFRTDGGSSKMIISNSGNVGIGTTSPSRPLHIRHAVPVVNMQDADGTGASTASYIEILDSVGTRTGYVGDESSSNNNVAISADLGTVLARAGVNACQYNSGASWSCSSDIRMKERIEPLIGSIDLLTRLQGVSYHWREPSKAKAQHIGLIAQEVQKVYPEIVSVDDRTGMLTLDYAGLIAPLIEAVKELKAANDNLKADNGNNAGAIEELRREIEALRAAR